MQPIPSVVGSKRCLEKYDLTTGEYYEIINQVYRLDRELDPQSPTKHSDWKCNGTDADIYRLPGNDEWVIRRERRSNVPHATGVTELFTHQLIGRFMEHDPVGFEVVCGDGLKRIVKPVDVLVAIEGIDKGKHSYSVRKWVEGKAGTELTKDEEIDNFLRKTQAVGVCTHGLGNILYGKEEAHLIEGRLSKDDAAVAERIYRMEADDRILYAEAIITFAWCKRASLEAGGYNNTQVEERVQRILPAGKNSEIIKSLDREPQLFAIPGGI